MEQRSERESALREVERRLRADPESVDLRFARARLLEDLGRISDARDEYIALLARAPAHREALNNLGGLLSATRHTGAARIAYAKAVARHPDDPVSRVNMGTLLYNAGEFDAAREHYAHALRVDPGNAQAHAGMAFVLADQGDEEGAAGHRRAGFHGRSVIPQSFYGDGPGITVLQLVSTTGGNVRARMFLDERVFRTFLVVPEFYDAATPLPPHDCVFNAIGDAEVSRAALVAAQALVAQTRAPVINPPLAVLETGRSDVARRVAAVPGVVTALPVTVARDTLTGATAGETLARYGLTFPFLVRAPGYHTGAHFHRVEGADDLAAAVASLPGRDAIALRFLDARGVDGKSRKYRVMMVDGRLYPLHLAISNHWKVHYFTSDMAESSERRAEEAAFLSDMWAVLGSRAMAALEGIQAVLGLDYGGIDFALNDDGDVLLFEANATMVVNPPDDDARWDYRRAAVDRVYAAVRDMLLRRSG